MVAPILDLSHISACPQRLGLFVGVIHGMMGNMGEYGGLKADTFIYMVDEHSPIK